MIENLVCHHTWINRTLSQGKVICRKHSNDVARQVEVPSKRTIFVARQIITFMLHQWLGYTMTAKQVNDAIDVVLV